MTRAPRKWIALSGTAKLHDATVGPCARTRAPHGTGFVIASLLGALLLALVL